MNKLPDEEVDRIKLLTLAGCSTRQIKAVTGRAKNTIMFYRNWFLAQCPVLCPCGKPVTHQGWCRERVKLSPVRQEFLGRWRHPEHYTCTCLVCGGPRHIMSGRLCAKCFKKQSEERKARLALVTRRCRICNGEATIFHHKGHPTTCDSEWCKRLYVFYYVEGRSRPPSVRDGKKNGLRFELFLADYLRRYANEQGTGTKHGRTTGCTVRGVGGTSERVEQSG